MKQRGQGDIEIIVIIACLIVLIILAVIGIEYSERTARNEFMEACLKDHKQYECTAMWRAGQTNTVIMPMPIITR